MARLQIRHGKLPTQTVETLVELTGWRHADQALLGWNVERGAQGLLSRVRIDDTGREQLAVE